VADRKPSAFVSFDGMCWPAAGSRASSLEWQLRYQPEALTREDQLVLASVVSAYLQMVRDPEAKRRRVIRKLREARDAEPPEADDA
jgi:hypothetical protein